MIYSCTHMATEGVKGLSTAVLHLGDDARTELE